MKKKISVIVCVYNGEKYINRCMESLRNQTIGIEALQIILVNDGSTDATLEYMKEWEKKYPEDILIVSYEKNLGAGGARNIGIEYAECDYIAFLDCDDWVEKDMYQKLYVKAEEFQCDVVKCKYSWDFKENILEDEIKAGEDKFYKKTDFKEEFPFWELDLDVGINGDYGSFWSGIYKRTLITENHLFFPEKLYYEDNFFEDLINLYMERVYIVDEILYHYYVNLSSTSKKPNDIKHLDRLKVELLLLDELKKRGVYTKKPEIVEKKFIYRFYLNTMHILFTKFDVIPNILPQMKEIIENEFPNYKNNVLLKNKPIWELLLKLLDIEPACTPEELEDLRADYLSLYNHPK